MIPQKLLKLPMEQQSRVIRSLSKRPVTPPTPPKPESVLKMAKYDALDQLWKRRYVQKHGVYP